MPASLLYKPEVVLEADRRERLRFALDLDAFLRFHGLVQTVAPAAARHQTAGEFIDDDHLAVLHDIILIALENDVSLERLLNVVVPLHVLRLIHVADAEQLLHLQHAFFGEGGGAVFFIDGEIAGGVLLARLFAFDHFAANQVRDDLVGLVILVGRFLARAGDDQRRPRFVDQDRIDFIDNGEVMPALHAVRRG